MPPAFVIPAALDADLDATQTAIDTALAGLEARTGARLGGTENPLLVSVRSGGRASMPGMMDTILNLGLNDAARAGLGAATGKTPVEICADLMWTGYNLFRDAAFRDFSKVRDALNEVAATLPPQASAPEYILPTTAVSCKHTVFVDSLHHCNAQIVTLETV